MFFVVALCVEVFCVWLAFEFVFAFWRVRGLSVFLRDVFLLKIQGFVVSVLVGFG